MSFRQWLETAGPRGHLRFEDNHRDTIGGGFDAEHKYTVLAYDADEPGGRAVGGIDYTVTSDGKCHIDHIEVREERRREGIGEALMDWISAKFGGYRNLDLGGYATSAGHKLIARMERKAPPPPDQAEEWHESWVNGNLKDVAQAVLETTDRAAVIRLAARMGQAEAAKLSKMVENRGGGAAARPRPGPASL